jgi:hypothetical protein
MLTNGVQSFRTFCPEMGLAAIYRLMARGPPGVLCEFKEAWNAGNKATVAREPSQNVFYVGVRIEDINLK